MRFQPNDKQSKLLADKVMDLANLATAALVFGEVLSRQRPRVELIGAGISVYLAAVVFSLSLRR